MKTSTNTVSDYLSEIIDERKSAFTALRETILKNIPKGFEECMSYGMIGYVVPHSIYTKGYHCDTKLPLPFVAIASQKNGIALHHMGLYFNPALSEWFAAEYPKHSKYKLDMGKACIRFKKMDGIPLELIAQLLQKFSVENYISIYESNLKLQKS
jgi:uncharacterized protein YdhG (YjbR/CyaY superfamily)